ncbi:DNA polymerase zeta catalytic subunit isoform X2 [Uranotaenia lowii]|uniref:DNA polymerase zeta catalytic subunit isoform X2 n=1 Tax=Uranotaenia lowii TaxID=190385 RepID=UPI0024787FFA|nr:DNA polymerase zeta catalytic subunit isoform X2 [Uranotaenia lowii]
MVRPELENEDIRRDVTSVRIVSVDHYMHKPDGRFDSCYSEFRGTEVKQVPVVRLFGANAADGTHCCVHIHGVFPYLYVPYDGNTNDRLAVDRLMYQLAASLDKAINVSLGNANSAATHVFRISLVKGIPIYGYHRKDHQFLKIYLYNPQLIRKATNLLMNGVILSRVFQTYETHVPYVLQFFIDYNLYGMSLLDIQSSAIRERIEGMENGPAKMSTSECEIDIMATGILNRDSLERDKRCSEYANPGIASIWNDEKVRRKLLEMKQPEPMVGLSQSGKLDVVSESDRYFRTLLLSRLSGEATNTQGSSESREDKRAKPPVSFYPSEVGENDEQLLEASYVQDHKNYSQLQDSFNQSNTMYNFDLSQVDEDRIVSLSQNPDATFVEEDQELLDIMRALEEHENQEVEQDSLLAPLTQVSQKKCTPSGGIGSSQGSSSKQFNMSLIDKLEAQFLLGESVSEDKHEATEQDDIDSDDEFLLDYTMKLDTQPASSSNSETEISPCIPQLDGAHTNFSGNEKWKSKSAANKRTRNKSHLTNGQATVNGNGHPPDLMKRPRLSQSFTELGPTKRPIGLSPEVRKKLRTEQNEHAINESFTDPVIPDLKDLQVRLQRTPLITKPKQSNGGTHTNQNGSCTIESDITCMKKSLKVRIEHISSCMPKITNGSGNGQVKHNGTVSEPEISKMKQLKVRLSRIDLAGYRQPPREFSPPVELLKKDAPLPPLVELPKRGRSRFRSAQAYDTANGQDPMEGTSRGPRASRKRNQSKKRRGRPRSQRIAKSSGKVPSPEPDIEIALSQRFQDIIRLSPRVMLQHLSKQQMQDLKPGSSSQTDTQATQQMFESDGEMRSSGGDPSFDLPEISQSDSETVSRSPVPDEKTNVADHHTELSEVEEEDEEDLKIQSFYEKTLVYDDFDELDLGSDESLTDFPSGPFPEEDGTGVTVTLEELPPTFEEALKALQTFVIPQVINQEPFYSNSDDVTGRKEVGHVVLNIAGDDFCTMEKFKSVVPGLGSISQIRLEKLKSIYGDSLSMALGENNSTNSERMNELLASEKPVVIHPALNPPSKHEAKVWLEALKSVKQKDPVIEVEEESPIKIKKMQAIMVGEMTENSQEPLKSSIDSECTVNLSSLISETNRTTDSKSRKSLVSKILTMNTVKNSPSPTSSFSTTLAGSPSTLTPSGLGADKLELLSYSARRKRQKIPKARLSLSTAFKRLRSEKFIEVTISQEDTIQPGQDSSMMTDVEEGIDVVNSSQLMATSQKSEGSDCASSDQTSVICSAEVASMKQRLLEAGEGCSTPNVENISSVTPSHDNTYGFKLNFENLQKAKATCEYSHLALMSVEIHVQTRGDLRPNPESDPISAVFYRVHNDVPENHRRAPSVCGIILNGEHGLKGVDRPDPYKYNRCNYTADVVTVANERELYEKFLVLIAFWDPDIFAGYEIEQGSWGYIIQRGYVLEMNLMKMLSRVPTAEKVHVSEEEEQDLLEMHEYSAGLKIPGRILLDIWRLMRHEIALTAYTFENIVYHILHRRVPKHSFRQLTRLWNKPYTKWVVLEYYLERVNGNFELLQQLDLISRTAELAKLFGIQFYEVLSRGSQFRVESMMLRIAKPRNFVSVSPSIQQRAHMRAPEYIPLILEPNSRFYADPVIVLDFQSLYPSMIIAYNYCFATCLGRVEHLGQTEPFEFGASHLRISPRMLKILVEKELITVSPCGVAFLKSSVREGILPRMLNEILSTRLMVKASMKLHKENNILQRVLHSRQLGLKLIANVTYGYTAANFSGRMPCVEVGDSVVSKGRETLERAIKFVEENQDWGAKVVYGDTDSLFVLCPGRTKEAAFKIGEEIAEAVTRENPPPVKLKLEKVYQPCILQTKKRYVGFMYESADQEKPVYEAKGIETVRRDGCPVVSKMLEKVLRILFETRDVSKVKEYTCRQFTKILEGRVNLQDFIFAKEFRGQDGYKPGACVPALELTRRWKMGDPRKEPRRGERVPYVIINGPPLVPLIRLVRSPDEVLEDSGLKINSNYYITKAIIPPLNRCLLLIGADVNQWYNDLPRKFLLMHNSGGGNSKGSSRSLLANELRLPKKSTISQYFSTTSCIGDCNNQTHTGICENCRKNPQKTTTYVMNKINHLERRVGLCEQMCKSCCQRTFETDCISLDCPVLFVSNQRKRELTQVQFYRELLEQHF